MNDAGLQRIKLFSKNWLKNLECSRAEDHIVYCQLPYKHHEKDLPRYMTAFTFVGKITSVIGHKEAPKPHENK